MLLRSKTHQGDISPERVEAKSCGPVIELDKGECVYCHLKGQPFIEFLHPAIVFQTSAQLYPILWFCLLAWVLPLCPILWTSRTIVSEDLVPSVESGGGSCIQACFVFDHPILFTHGSGTNLCPCDKKVNVTVWVLKEVSWRVELKYKLIWSKKSLEIHA